MHSKNNTHAANQQRAVILTGDAAKAIVDMRVRGEALEADQEARHEALCDAFDGEIKQFNDEGRAVVSKSLIGTPLDGATADQVMFDTTHFDTNGVVMVKRAPDAPKLPKGLADSLSKILGIPPEVVSKAATDIFGGGRGGVNSGPGHDKDPAWDNYTPGWATSGAGTDEGGKSSFSGFAGPGGGERHDTDTDQQQEEQVQQQ